MKNLTPLKRAFQATAQTHPLPLRTRCHLPAETANTIILERTILNPEHSETCKSGTDDEVGRHKSPYDPKQTNPEQEHLALEEEYRLEGNTMHDPLYVSPANREFSRVLDPQVGGQALKHLRSVRGWTNKHKEVLLRTDPYKMRKYESAFSPPRKPMDKVRW